jgi:serine/threonine-protein kinase SRK2
MLVPHLAPLDTLHAALAQRILSVDYQLPYNKAVSGECKDLLQRILVADPAKRITMADIQRHPWFTRDLPEGVAQMNDQLLAQQQHVLAHAGY